MKARDLILYFSESQDIALGLPILFVLQYKICKRYESFFLEKKCPAGWIPHQLSYRSRWLESSKDPACYPD